MDVFRGMCSAFFLILKPKTGFQRPVFKVEIVKNVEKPSDLICLYQILFVLEKVRKKVYCHTHCIV